MAMEQVRGNAGEGLLEVGDVFVMGKKGGASARARARASARYRSQLATVAGRGQQRRGNGHTRRRQEARRTLQLQWQEEQVVRDEKAGSGEVGELAILGMVRAMVIDVEALCRMVVVHDARRCIWQWRQEAERAKVVTMGLERCRLQARLLVRCVARVSWQVQYRELLRGWQRAVGAALEARYRQQCGASEAGGGGGCEDEGYA